MEGTYIQEGCRHPSCTPKNYLEYGSRWFCLRNLWINLILSISYNFGQLLISFYGTSDLCILVISPSKILTNILMVYQSSATLRIHYLINAPLSFKLICPRPNLSMGKLVLPQNRIKVSQFTVPFLGWTLIKFTKRLSMKVSMAKPARCWSRINLLGWSMEIQ